MTSTELPQTQIAPARPLPTAASGEVAPAAGTSGMDTPPAASAYFARMGITLPSARAARRPRETATPSQIHALGAVRSVPRFVRAVHDQWCHGGFIDTQEEDFRGQLHSVSARCPLCEQAAAAQRLRQQLVQSGVDGRYLDTDWADLEVLAPLDRVRDACGRIGKIIETGACLLLWSEGTGSGKTQGAMLTAKAAVQAKHTAHVVNIARLAVDVRESYRDRGGDALSEKAALGRLTAPDLLVIDDLGAGESDTAAVERRLLFLALDHRQTHRKPTVITSNVRPETLIQIFGARIFARLTPLAVLHVNHGVNFRTRDQQDGLW